jgi:hypothetical protein
MPPLASMLAIRPPMTPAFIAAAAVMLIAALPLILARVLPWPHVFPNPAMQARKAESCRRSSLRGRLRGPSPCIRSSLKRSTDVLTRTLADNRNRRLDYEHSRNNAPSLRAGVDAFRL